MASKKKEEKGMMDRPKVPRKRSPDGVRRVRFQVSCQPEELALIKSKAKKAGMSISRFVVDGALSNR